MVSLGLRILDGGVHRLETSEREKERCCSIRENLFLPMILLEPEFMQASCCFTLKILTGTKFLVLYSNCTKSILSPPLNDHVRP